MRVKVVGGFCHDGDETGVAQDAVPSGETASCLSTLWNSAIWTALIGPALARMQPQAVPQRSCSEG